MFGLSRELMPLQLSGLPYGQTKRAQTIAQILSSTREESNPRQIPKGEMSATKHCAYAYASATVTWEIIIVPGPEVMTSSGGFKARPNGRAPALS